MFRELFFRERSVQRVEEFQKVVEISFERLKQDNHAIRQWLNFLWTQNLAQQKQVSELKEMLENMPVNKQQIARIIDEHYAFEPLLDRLRRAETKVEELSAIKGRVNAIEEAQKPIFERLREISLELSKPKPAVIVREQPQERERTFLQERIVKQLTRNSKETIKTLILSMIRKYQKISGLQLREMIVEEQHLCSKSSFYRLLDGLEKELGLQVVVDGKEKVYFSDAQAKQHPGT